MDALGDLTGPGSHSKDSPLDHTLGLTPAKLALLSRISSPQASGAATGSPNPWETKVHISGVLIYLNMRG